MKGCKRFIIIDDDSVNNFLCSKMIENIVGNSHVSVYTNPYDALSGIANEYVGLGESATLLLDINMPEMTGWEFLAYFNKFHPEIKNRIKICLLSGSIDNKDRVVAEANNNVSHFLAKPVSMEALAKVLN